MEVQKRWRTEEMKTNPNFDSLFRQLAGPFDSSEIKWRVLHAARDGSRGVVIAFADPRAYTDHLNHLFTPTDWTRTYEVSTVSSVTRMKKDKLIQTGKVLVTGTRTIPPDSVATRAVERNGPTKGTRRPQRHRRSSGQQAVTAWGDTFTTSMRCGFLSMSAGSQSI